MDTFFENAHRIFDVASTAEETVAEGRTDSMSFGLQDFAVLVRHDGGLHFVMKSPVGLENLEMAEDARTIYRVSKSAAGVRVEGREGTRRCLMESKPVHLDFLRDTPCYRISSPALTAGPADPAGSAFASSMRWE